MLTCSAEGLRDVRWYCPDTARYAYVVLHTGGQRIFGLAFGMSAIAFRLPAAVIPEAQQDGGRVDPAIGPDWVVWQGRAPSNSRRWCKLAHDHAARDAGGPHGGLT